MAQGYYGFHWAAIGNLGVDILVIPLSKLFGLELAVKLIVLAIPPLTVAGFLWVAREVHGRIPPTALFALPFAYSHPFMFGFVNFALSIAFAFLAFGLWLRLARLDRLRLRAILFVPISLIVFFAHTFGWGVLGLLCFSAEAVRQHDGGKGWLRVRHQGRAARLGDGAAVAVHARLAERDPWRHDRRAGSSGAASSTGSEMRCATAGSLSTSARWASVGLVLLFAVVSRPSDLLAQSLFSALVLLIGFVVHSRGRCSGRPCGHAADSLRPGRRATGNPFQARWPRRACPWARCARHGVLCGPHRPATVEPRGRGRRPTASSKRSITCRWAPAWLEPGL